MTIANSNLYAIYHPEHFLDLLRAGAYFPNSQIFRLPENGSNENSMIEFIQHYFPPISEERHELWVKFQTDVGGKVAYSLDEIESVHFYSRFRQEAVQLEIIQALRTYGIPIKDPVDKISAKVLDTYDSMLRQHVATTITKAWFGTSISVSDEFKRQLTLGYYYQQSPAPDSLDPLPSNLIWARLVAYNPGIRKFVEKPRVLPLQDIQEVLKMTDQDFRDKLKGISEKHKKKFPDVIQDAEEHLKAGSLLSKWVLQERSKQGTYISDLDEFLSHSAAQESFLYTSMLYLYWRQEVLNKDYNGKLTDNFAMRSYLLNVNDNPLRQAIAEAVFTIVYAGGPRVFQNALIEARKKILNIKDIVPGAKEEQPPVAPRVPQQDPQLKKKPKFTRMVKQLAKSFSTFYDSNDKEKKNQLKKEIQRICSIDEMRKGLFNYQQYAKLCHIFNISPEEFDEEEISLASAAENSVSKEQELNFSASGNMKQQKEE